MQEYNSNKINGINNIVIITFNDFLIYVCHFF